MEDQRTLVTPAGLDDYNRVEDENDPRHPQYQDPNLPSVHEQLSTGDWGGNAPMNREKKRVRRYERLNKKYRKCMIRNYKEVEIFGDSEECEKIWKKWTE